MRHHAAGLTLEAWLGPGKTLLASYAGYFGSEIAKRVMDPRAKSGDGFAAPLAAATAVGAA